MANQKPISSVLAAGGYLIQPEVQQALMAKVARESAIFRLANTIRVNTNKTTWPVYLGRPTAGFVAEAATKPTTGAEFGTLEANIKKIATNVRYTTEILEDAVQDPRILINPDVEAAIADLADYHALGTHVGAANTTATYTTSFDAALQNCTTTVELANTGADRFATALSAAVALLEGKGYNRNLSVLAGYRLKQHLRDMRDAQTRPLYTESWGDADVPRIMGMPVEFSTNVNRTDAGVYDWDTAGLIGGAGSPGKTVAIVGDFSRAMAVIRNDLTTQVFREATIDGVNLAETNQIAVQYEVRMGFQIYDLNNAFVRIINAA
jgi:HK97 family phage major capsid protein